VVVAEASAFERFLVTGSRLFRNETVAFVGFHWPMLMARIARRLQAPDMVVLYEDGIVEDRLTPVLPTSPSDMAAAVGSPMCATSFDALYLWLNRAHVQQTFLEAPIVDRRGNVNTTAVGDYARPKVRLPGSGGGTELASFGPGLVLVSASTETRSYPKHVDYVTSPGYLRGNGERRSLGYAPGRGPQLLVNPLGLFEFEAEELRVKALHADVTRDEARACFGWSIAFSPYVEPIPQPDADELAVVREELQHAADRLYRLPEASEGTSARAL
jgi:glutaconate CoA-transferase subunit B